MSDEKSNSSEQESKRTNEHNYIVLRSETSKRLAAIFLSHERLTLTKMYRILREAIHPPSFTKSALRGVVRRWTQKGLLLTDGRSYILNPVWGINALVKALGGEEFVREQGILDSVSSIEKDPDSIRQVIVELTPRWWSEVFDLPASWRERTVIRTKFDIYIAEIICVLCESKPKPRDRTNRHVHREKTFTIEVFPISGKVHIWTKEDATWLDKLGRWLKRGGLGASDMRLVASAIERQLTMSRSTLEVPLKLASTPVEEWNLHLEFGERTADLRLVRSHFGPPYGEMEIRADERYIVDWLGMVTGASIKVMEDETRFDELERQLKEQEEKIQESLSELKKLKDERDSMKKEREERTKKKPDYIG